MSLDVYLRDPSDCPGIGPERGRRPRASGIGKYVSPHGSTRYVAYVGSLPVAALQVVSRDGRHASVANVYVVPSHRRSGWASTLLARARKDFVSVVHNREDQWSEDGARWARARPDPRRRRSASPTRHPKRIVRG